VATLIAPAAAKRMMGARNETNRPVWAAVAVFLALAAVSSLKASHAQSAGSAPGFDPNQVEKKIEDRREQLQNAKQRAVRVPQIERSETPADTKPFFRLRSVSIVGAVALPAHQLATASEPYIGKTISQADMVAIASGISDRYRAAGYHLSRAIVPPQDLNRGRLRIRVIEGCIVKVQVIGDDRNRFGVRRILQPVATEAPSSLRMVERKLLLVNDVPGVKIADTQLEEIGTMSGKFRLIVKVETWSTFTAFGVDNTGTVATGPWQVYSSTSFNSYLVQGDSFNVSLSTVPDDTREMRFGRVAYDIPLGADGVRVGVSASHNDIWPGDFRRSVNTRTSYDTYEMRGTVVPYLTQRISFALTASAAFNEVYERDDFGPTYRDHVRSGALTADFKLRDDFNGWNYWTLTYRQGLNMFGASDPTDDLLSRNIVSDTFSLLSYAYTRYQRFTDVWSAKISVNGQFSSTALLDSQRYFLSSAAFGPGYYSGDNGIAGLFELRFDQTLNNPYVKGFQLYGFVEGGQVWDYKDPTSGLSLASTGGGIRFYLPGLLQAGIAVATPLYDTLNNHNRDYRILFTLSNAFKVCPERIRMDCSL
jgi:hemolysin activation/secretion protein